MENIFKITNEEGFEYTYVTNSDDIKKWCICEYTDGDIVVTMKEFSSGINKYNIIKTNDPDLLEDGIEKV